MNLETSVESLPGATVFFVRQRRRERPFYDDIGHGKYLSDERRNGHTSLFRRACKGGARAGAQYDRLCEIRRARAHLPKGFVAVPPGQRETRQEGARDCRLA